MAKKCFKYRGNTYTSEELFQKIRRNAEQFAKRHKISGSEIAKASGLNVNYNFAGAGAAMRFKNDQSKPYFSNLVNAHVMENNGAGSLEILISTGWFRGTDNQWRMELDYNIEPKEFVISDVKGNNEFKLSDIIDYPQLFELYPDFKDIKVVISSDKLFENENNKGFVKENTINLSYKLFKNGNNTLRKSNISLLIHEIQHLIQFNEVFGKGNSFQAIESIINASVLGIGNPTTNSNQYDRTRDFIERKYGKDWISRIKDGTLNQDQVVSDVYFYSLGEIESRDVQNRYENEDRRINFAPILQDVRLKDMALIFDEMPKISFSIQSNQQTPLPHKNTIPNKTFKDVMDILASQGLESAENALKTSSWYNNLSDTRKQEINRQGLVVTMQNESRKIIENAKVRRENNAKRTEQKEQSEKRIADSNPLQADENVVIKNDKPVNKFIAWKQKWFANEGGMLKPIMNLQDRAVGNSNLEIRNAKILIEDLNKAARKEGFTDWETFDKALRGGEDFEESYESLPNGIKPFVNEMRQRIDGISEFLVENDLVKPSQAMTIEENMGQYLTRAYEFFEGKNDLGKVFRRIFSLGDFKKQFDKDKWNNAVRVYQQNVLNEIAMDGSDKYASMNDIEKQSYARKEGARRLEEYIRTLSEEYNQAKSTRGANIDILKERKDVPTEIRALLGEYTDPRVSFALTIAKMSQMGHQRKFLQKVREVGMGTLFFEEGDTNIPSTHTVKIASDSNEAYSPLNGLYTTPEFKDVFLDKSEPITNDWINLWIKATGAVKYGKTILSPMTQAVNFTANFGFLTMNGLYDIRGFAAGSKVFFDEIKNSKSSDPFIQELIEENVIGQNVQLNEIQNDFHKNIEKTLLNDLKKSPIQKTIAGYSIELPQKLYKASDDFFKAYAYFQETNDYAKAMFGKPYKELQGEERARVRAIASEVVKNTLANYDRKYKAADVIRKGTRNLFGNFLSFQAESIRTNINATQIALRDIKNPETRAVGIRRLSGVMAYNALYATITSYIGQATGIGFMGLLAGFNDDDEDEKNRKLNLIVAPWARSTEKYVRINNDGTVTYFTYGNLNPYGITYRVMNAYNNGTDNEIEPGLKASLMELAEPFASTEMSVKWLLNVAAGKNDYGKELIGTSDYMEYTLNKLSPTFIKLYKDNVDGNKNNDFEMINFLGIKKYNIDMTSQLNFRFSDYQKKMNDIGKEIYGLQYKVADGKMSPEEANKKQAELIMKQKDIADEFIPIIEAHVSFGARTTDKGGIMDKGNKNYLNVFNSSKDWMPYITAPKEVREKMAKEGLNFSEK